MPSSLTATKIKDSYVQLLHVDGGVTTSLKTVYDGDGTATALKVSTTDVQVNNSPVLTDADIGSSVQAYDADLTAWAGKTAPAGAVVGTSDSQALTNKTISLGSNTVTGTSAQLATAISDETGSGSLVFATSPTLVTPNLGTPSALVGTNITGTASGLSIGGNAGTVTNGVYTTGDQTIGGNKTFSSNPIISSGVANGVAYLNGSKVLTTSSALTFDGTTLTAPTINATSLIVGGDITWNQSTDSYSRLSGVPATTPVVTDVHRNMRRCLLRDDLTVNYYLDPTNSALKADGTASTLTGADGQVMVEIPAFYVKFTPGSNRNYAVSLLPSPGYTLHPAFMKDGAFVPYRYYGSYDACVFNGSVYESGLNYDNNWSAGQNWSADGAAAKLSSVSGVYPAVGATRANFRSMAANRGTGWREVDFYLESAVQLLYLVEYGSFNSQAKLSNGNVSVTNAYNAPSSGNQTDSPHSVAGKSNSLGNASTNTTNGAASSTRDTAFMSYRGIENWYGNCLNWVDGFNINNNQAYVSNVRSAFADDTATGYDSLGAPMINSDGWVTNVQQVPFGFLPSAVGGGSTTYLADYYSQNSGWRVAGFGGAAANGAIAGAFSWFLNGDSGTLSRIFGGRLAA